MKVKNHTKVLNWVNLQRKNLGLKSLAVLPKGIPEDVNSCPIATALTTKDIQVEVDSEVRLTQNIPVPKAVHDFISKLDSDDYDFSELLDNTITSTQRIELPAYVEAFISNFDKGLYPELVED